MIPYDELNTIKLLEPSAFVPGNLFTTTATISIAISLKRIADALDNGNVLELINKINAYDLNERTISQANECLDRMIERKQPKEHSSRDDVGDRYKQSK